jgi:hypothetical protein
MHRREAQACPTAGLDSRSTAVWKPAAGGMCAGPCVQDDRSNHPDPLPGLFLASHLL